MEQIQQHEWVDDIFPGSICLQCKTVKSYCINGNIIYRRVGELSTQEEPACITRTVNAPQREADK